jgi:hypothetical protein
MEKRQRFTAQFKRDKNGGRFTFCTFVCCEAVDAQANAGEASGLGFDN